MISDSVIPFESAAELRDAHERLLEALDEQLGPDPSAAMETQGLLRLEPQVREFVERGAATGAYLEEITERTACQTLVDYWASNLARAGAHIGRARLAQFDNAHLPILPDEPCPSGRCSPAARKTRQHFAPGHCSILCPGHSRARALGQQCSAQF